jgi:pimeloyl-ACP methyl ester carboxylesterase
MRPDRATLWLAAVLLAALLWRAGSTWMAPANGARLDRLEPTACWFEVPQGRSAVCGYLRVPDHRDRGLTTHSRLAVAIFRPAAGVRHPDPVLFLSGGPGGAFGFAAGKGWWWRWIDTVALAGGREFVAMDQRGVGQSRPRVDCPGLRVLQKRLLQRELSPEEQDRQWLAAVASCRQRLLSEGFDLSVFGSAESAADIEDLRRALGYAQWNLYGISYGTRLALRVARDDADGVRSLVLDSVYPPEAESLVEGALGLDFALRMVWAPCAADPDCERDHPAMRATLERVVERLNRDPAAVRFVHPDTLDTYVVVLDGDRLIEALIVGMSGHADVRRLAAAVAGLDRGEAHAASELVRDYWVAMQDEDFSYPVNYSVECREEVPFNDLQRALFDAAHFPLVARHERRDAELMAQICAVWGLDPVPRGREPVRTTIPALILAGVFDPVTPMSWVERTVQYLPNAHLFRFDAGHSVTDADPCALELIAAFLERPHERPKVDCHPRAPGATVVTP